MKSIAMKSIAVRLQTGRLEALDHMNRQTRGACDISLGQAC
jgi:hypothetical protein